MNLPKITKKQQEIVKLLYSHRFLSRIQIQALLGHKDYKTINLWLRDLRTKQYVGWIYSTHYAERTKPAIYYLGINGIRYLTSLASDDYPVTELRKRYKEVTRSQSYIDRCLLLADCCITLERAHMPKTGTRPESWYFYETLDTYVSDGYYHFITDEERIRPHLCFAKVVDDGADEPRTKQSFLLEVFDTNLPRYRIKKKLDNYLKYLNEVDWQGETDGDPQPALLFVCPRTTDLIYAKRRMRGLLANDYEYDEENRPEVWFITAEKLRETGVLGEAWEKA